MIDISDIPTLPDRDQRLSEILVDCYGQGEELSSFEVYLTEALQFPFKATWRDSDQPGHALRVTVLNVQSVSDRRGILLTVQRRDKQRRVVAEQLWVDDATSTNAIVLDDYRYWVDNGGLLPEDFGY